MKLIREANKKQESDVMKEYRKITGFSGEKLEEGMLNEVAVRNIAFNRGLVESDIRHMLLTEDTFADMLEREARGQQIEVDADDSRTEIEKKLDKYTKLNQRNNRYKDKARYYSVMIEGTAGIGKSEIVKKWCYDNGKHIADFELSNLPVEIFGGLAYPSEPDESGARFTQRLPGIELYKTLSVPNTVLFLDEYNMGGIEVRRAMYDLALHHTLRFPIGQEKAYERFGEIISDGVLWFPTLDMIVAAQNPSDGVYDRETMDPAESRRFVHVKYTANPIHTWRWIDPKLKSQKQDALKDGDEELARIIQGQWNLANKILHDPHFVYETGPSSDSDDNLYLNPAQLSAAIMASDGTKDDFLDTAPEFVGVRAAENLEAYLDNYVDIDDKANQAIGVGFAEKPSLAKQFKGKLRDLQKQAIADT